VLPRPVATEQIALGLDSCRELNYQPAAQCQPVRRLRQAQSSRDRQCWSFPIHSHTVKLPDSVCL
jgi:hypothetical protein